MLAYASMLEHLLYAQNYARIIHQGLILALYNMILNKYFPKNVEIIYINLNMQQLLYMCIIAIATLAI